MKRCTRNLLVDKVCVMEKGKKVEEYFVCEYMINSINSDVKGVFMVL